MSIDLGDRILDAAQRLAFRTGARRMSLSDVATLSGVSRPTIYRYFASKEELIDALGKRERQRLAAAMAEATSGVVGWRAWRPPSRSSRLSSRLSRPGGCSISNRGSRTSRWRKHCPR